MNSPQGGPPPPHPICSRTLGDCHAFKACICRTALLKAHGEMKAHILATICPDFGTWRSWLFWHTRLFVCEMTTSKKRTPKRHEFKTEPTKPNLLVRNTFLPTFCRKIDPRTFRKRPKSRPRGSKIEAWGLQNRAWSPPGRDFLKTFNLRR